MPFKLFIQIKNRAKNWIPVLAISAALIGCGELRVEQDYPDGSGGATQESGSVFDYFTFKNDATKKPASPSTAPLPQASATGGLAVNADLWRGALDTVRFMPLAAADPTGGTIITDWYNDPGSDKERVKINVVISGLELRADALRVSIFREKWRSNRWTAVAASPRAARQLENIILTRARDFSIARRDAQ